MLKSKISAAMPEEMKRGMTSPEGETVCERPVGKDATPREIAEMVVESIGNSIRLSEEGKRQVMAAVEADVMRFHGREPEEAAKETARQAERQAGGMKMR